MSSIGGYITFGLHREHPLKPGAIALNSGRNALECLLRIRGYRVLHAPAYTCGVLRRPIEKAGVELRLYEIDEFMEPQIDPASVGGEEALLYTNYLGLKDATIQHLAGTCPTLIVDQAQAFYATTPPGVDSFDSVRKFLPVPDGSFLHLNTPFNLHLERDHSHQRCAHLLQGSDEGPEQGFAAFQANENRIDALPPGTMSGLTAACVSQADHDAIKARRRANNALLHEALTGINQLRIDPAVATVPLAYPLWTDDTGLRSRLIAERIYVPTFWPDLLGPVESGTAAARFRDNLICLPVDQRQGPKEMERILEVLD